MIGFPDLFVLIVRLSPNQRICFCRMDNEQSMLIHKSNTSENKKADFRRLFCF
jgi:hypothetical protein